MTELHEPVMRRSRGLRPLRDPEVILDHLRSFGITCATAYKIVEIPERQDVGLKLWRYIDYVIAAKGLVGWVRVKGLHKRRGR